MRPNLKLRFEREGPLRVVGLIWTNDGLAWRRHLVRRHEAGDAPVISELVYVDPTRVFCPKCLDSHVQETKGLFASGGATGEATIQSWFDCLACGLHWWWVEEPRTLQG